MEEFINTKFVLCINNEEYPADLESFKVYKVIPDKAALEVEHIRIIDESGEDYIYPQSFFTPINLPVKVSRLFKSKMTA